MPCSLKVTCLLSLAGLGKGAHLFTESPMWPATEGTCSLPPVSRCCLWLLEHPSLYKCWQLPNHPWLPDHPWEMEQHSLLMWPPSRLAATSTWWWIPLAILRASSWDFCHLFLIWLEVACILCWNVDWGSDLEVLADPHPGSSGWVGPCLCQRCSFGESRISWQITSSISGSHDTVLGALFSWYTSLYSTLISSKVVL